MTPIINPMLFYWASVFDILKIICGIFAFLALIASLIILADGIEMMDSKENKKMLITFSIIFLITLLGFVFIPSKRTVYQMIVFQNINEDNLGKCKDDVKEIIDYTIEKIDEVDNEK